MKLQRSKKYQGAGRDSVQKPAEIHVAKPANKTQRVAKLNRYVYAKDCSWLQGDMDKGRVVYPSNILASDSDMIVASDFPGRGPYYELPRKALDFLPDIETMVQRCSGIYELKQLVLMLGGIEDSLMFHSAENFSRVLDLVSTKRIPTDMITEAYGIREKVRSLTAA